MWWFRGGGESYPPEEVEALLQRGELKEALKKGWFGDEFSYRLVRTSAETLQTMNVVIAQHAGDLGLDLRNEDGVATVGQITPGMAAARDGQLERGDVIRTVDGVTCYTCEAAVRAIKAARRGSVGGVPVAPLVLEAVRPPVLHEWREELSLTAGEFKRLPFEMSAPACLTYWWRSAGHATTLSVVRLDGQPKARKSKSEPQTAILDLSGRAERGHVLLARGGRYVISLDNADAVWRGVTLRYLLRVVPLSAWEAGRQVERLRELEGECARCEADSKELDASVAKSEVM